MIVFSLEIKLLSSGSLMEIVAPDNPFPTQSLASPFRLSFNPLEEKAPNDCPAEPLKFKERKLLPLAVRDIDGKPFDWNYKLVQRLAAGEKLPENKGKGGQNFVEYLRRKSIKNTWLSICAEAEAEGLECVPYSFRHRYAYVAHTRPQKIGTYRTPKQIAVMMGHDTDTNNKNYARFQTKNLDMASDLEELQEELV